MPRQEAMHFDVGVVEGGVTGLMVAKKLSALGYKTGLIEREATLCSGPSTRNEGILHRGTRHAVATPNLESAARIVAKCQYGADQILQYAPESIADPNLKTFAIVTPDDDVSAITSRWDELGVAYREVSLDQFARLVPQADTAKIEHVFQTADVPINLKILYQKLLADAQRDGTQVLLNSNFIAEDEHRGIIQDRDGGITPVHAELFVVTTGYNIQQVFQQATGDELPVRFWKSHLVITPKLADHGVMYLKPNGANITHQGNKTVSGQWDDGVLVDRPDTTPIPEKVAEVFAVVEETFPSMREHLGNHMVVACVKPDISRATGQARSVDGEIFEAAPSYLLVLPGKMTEAPHAADAVVRRVCTEMPNALISTRPYDVFNPSREQTT